MGLDVFGRALSAAHHAARGPPGIGINLTKDGHYDMQKKKIINVGNPENPCDCTPYGVMIERLKPVNEALNEFEKWRTEEQKKVDENAGKLDYIIKTEIPQIHEEIKELYKKRVFFG